MMSSASRQTSRVQTPPFRRTLLLFAVTAVLASGQLYAVIPLFGAMGRDWGTAPTGLTWLVSAFGFGYAAGFLLLGPLADRYGSRRMIVAGTVASAALTALIAVAPGYDAGVALRAAQGFTSAAFAPAAFAYIAKRIDPARRATAMTIVTSAFLASAVLAQLAAQGIVTVGWRALFIAWAVAYLLVALALRAVLSKEPSTASGSILTAYRALPQVLGTTSLHPLFLATLAILGAFVAIYTGLQLAGPAGIAGDAGALLTLRATGLPAIVAIPFLMPWLSRIPAARRAALAFGLAAAAVLLMGLVPLSTAGLTLLLALFVAGIAAGAPSVLQTIGARAGEARGTAVSLFIFLLFVGASLGPQVAAVLAGHGFAVLALTLAGVLAAAAALTLISYPRRKS